MNTKINLNTTTVEELAQLPNIGPKLAKRIIEYRDAVRPFENPVEITAVPGISEQMYQAIADRLTVSAMDAPEPKPVKEDDEEEEDDEIGRVPAHPAT